MISKRIIANSGVGQGAHSPAVEHFMREQAFSDLGGAFRLRDSGPERVPGVGGENRSLTIALLQCERVVAIVDPEIAIETLAQPLSLLLQSRCPLFLAYATKECCHLDFCPVDVTLHLNQCDRGLGERAIGVYDPVARVFPALVREALLDFAVILYIPISICVPVLFDPIKGRLDLRAQLIKQPRLTAPGSVFSHENQPERRGVDGPIVRRVRYLPQVGHFSYAQLVQNLAGLFLSPGV